MLIHKVQRAGESYYSVLLSQAHDYYELTEGTEWVKFLDTNSAGKFQTLRITVKKVYATEADITISSTFSPTECRRGEVTAKLPVASFGVDSVCLEKERDVTNADIKRQVGRHHFYSDSVTYGANACRSGKVWRAIDAYDFVCVDQKRYNFSCYNVICYCRKEDVAEESLRNVDRFNSSSDVCDEPYLERRAFPNDRVCVTSTEKQQAEIDNVQSIRYLKYFEFFNGNDSVGP